MNGSKKESNLEWACRIIMTLQVIIIINGFIVLFQTKYQLVSPLIPQSLVYEISYPYCIASFISGAFLIAALWFYFFRKKLLVIIIGGASLLLYGTLVAFFVK